MIWHEVCGARFRQCLLHLHITDSYVSHCCCVRRVHVASVCNWLLQSSYEWINACSVILPHPFPTSTHTVSSPVHLLVRPPTNTAREGLPPPATPKCLGGNREAKSLPASGGSPTQPLPRSLLREGAQLNHCPGLCFGGRARHGSYTAPVLATMVMKAAMMTIWWPRRCCHGSLDKFWQSFAPVTYNNDRRRLIPFAVRARRPQLHPPKHVASSRVGAV